MRISSGLQVLIIALSVGGTAVAQEDAAVNPEETKVSREEAGQTVVEHRIEGRLESLSVTPNFGPEYFIEDRQGDGSLTNLGGDSVDTDINIRTWKLGEW